MSKGQPGEGVVQQQFPFSFHHHHPSFYDFFHIAIAPFTGAKVVHIANETQSVTLSLYTIVTLPSNYAKVFT